MTNAFAQGPALVRLSLFAPEASLRYIDKQGKMVIGPQFSIAD
jgi:hypothetical protein